MKIFFAALMTIQIASAHAVCTAICTYKICDERSVCEEGGQNVSSSYQDLTIIHADSFAQLETICEDSSPREATINLYTVTQSHIRALYLQRVWLAYDTKATEANSCF